jgi:phosphatidylglycerophosphate synthase
LGTGVGGVSAIRWAIPWVLVGLRALGCPLIVAGAWRGWSGGWLGAIVVVALVSDIYDGILARRWDGETAGLRMSDSTVDTIFYLGAVWALWIRESGVLRENSWWLVGLFGIEGSGMGLTSGSLGGRRAITRIWRRRGVCCLRWRWWGC